MFSLAAGAEPFEGDRLVTRVGATLKVVAAGCERKVPESSTAIIDAGFCDAVFASADEATLAEVTAAQAGVGTGAALPILGGLLAAAGVVGAAGGGGSSSSN